MSDKKQVPVGIQALRLNAVKAYAVQAGSETFYFKKDNYLTTKALSDEVKKIRDAIGPAPVEPVAPEGGVVSQDERKDYFDAVADYMMRQDEATVKTAALIMFHKRLADKNGALMFEGATVEDIERELTVTDAQQFMLAYNAFQINLTKVPDAEKRFQG